MNLDTWASFASFEEWSQLTDVGKNILFVAIAIGVSTAIVWLWKLLLASIRLFQTYWVSLEDED